MTPTIRNRHRVRDKDLEDLVAHLRDAFGMDPFEGPVERGDSDEGPVLLAGGRVVAARLDEDPNAPFLPTVHGMLARPPTRAWVTVDMGAVPHVTNGADVMAPGIVDADPGIAEGAPVWVRDERNEKPLAVGRALVEGPAMVAGDSGKAVATLHHVGDTVFALEL